MLSIVIPSKKAPPSTRDSFEVDPFDTLENYKNHPQVEIITVDLSESPSRAGRLNIGLHRSKGNLILLHHPRSKVESSGIDYLISKSLDLEKKATPVLFWGGFTHSFDLNHPLLNFTSWYSNTIRGGHTGVLYLDHCIYFHRSLWIKDIPEVDIFEDTLLSYQLKKSCRPEISPFKSTTSSVRFRKNGIFLQSTMNQILKICFHLNISPTFLNKIYEYGLSLNSNYRNNKTTKK